MGPISIMPACGRNGNAVDESGGPRGYPAMIFYLCPSMPPEYLDKVQHEVSLKVAPTKTPAPVFVGPAAPGYTLAAPGRLIRRESGGLMNSTVVRKMPRDKRVRVAQSGKHMALSFATSLQMCPHLLLRFYLGSEQLEKSLSLRRRVRNTGCALRFRGDETVPVRCTSGLYDSFNLHT